MQQLRFAAAATASARDFVPAVNALCEQLETEVVAMFPDGFSPGYPVAQYRERIPKLRALYQDFDRKLARIPVPAPAEPAAVAFTEYVRESDQTKGQAEAAAAVSQAAYDAEFQRQELYFATDAVLGRRDAAGFSASCNYR